MFCTQCGAPQAQGARFCQRCGNALAAGIAPVAAAPSSSGWHAQGPHAPAPGSAAPQRSAEPVALWSETVVGVVAFLLTPAAGLVLAALNYRRMGLPATSRKFGLGAGVATVMFAVLAHAGGGGRLVLLLTGIGVFFYLYERTRTDLAAFTATGGAARPESWGVGAVLGLCVAALQVALTLLFALPLLP